MRGISIQAVIDITPILGTEGHPYEAEGRVWREKDIALPQEPCKWMPNCFMSIEYKYKIGCWKVMHDCVYGDDLNIEEIKIVSEILKAEENPILYSISPGTHVTLEMAEKGSCTWWFHRRRRPVRKIMARPGYVPIWLDN